MFVCQTCGDGLGPADCSSARVSCFITSATDLSAFDVLTWSSALLALNIEILMDGEDRRVSVYDLTGLRIHPDGYRVHQTERNSELGRYPRNIHSARGWVADDAGGSIGVPKYRRQKSAVPSESEYIEAKQDEEGEEDEPDPEIASSGGKRKKKPNNIGPIKRRRFVEDDSYLSSRSSPGYASLNDLGMPSQVRLNCETIIHCPLISSNTSRIFSKIFIMPPQNIMMNEGYW